jgi:hypothetical protein
MNRKQILDISFTVIRVTLGQGTNGVQRAVAGEKESDRSFRQGWSSRFVPSLKGSNKFAPTHKECNPTGYCVTTALRHSDARATRNTSFILAFEK